MDGSVSLAIFEVNACKCWLNKHLSLWDFAGVDSIWLGDIEATREHDAKANNEQ
jgi:hypothetical protein